MAKKIKAEQTGRKTLADLRRKLTDIPRLGEDALAFESDVRAARGAQPPLLRSSR